MKNVKDLDEVPLSEIEKYLAERKEKEHREEVARAMAINKIVVDNIDVFLQLTPEHDLSSCSDKKLSVSSAQLYEAMPEIPRCTRCLFLQVKKSSYFPSTLATNIRIVWGPAKGEESEF